LTGNTAIPSAVALNFVQPEFHVAARSAVTFRAPVPEASIDEDNHAFRFKGKIRAPRERKMPPPVLDAVFTKEQNHADFRATITLAAHSSHDFRSLLFAPNVSHLNQV